MSKILDETYCFEKHATGKTRYNETASTGGYQPLEQLRNKVGELFIHYGDAPDRFNFTSRRRPDKALTKGSNISSLFVPDVTLPYAYGDIKGTEDAVLVVFSGDYLTFELFIAKGQKNNRVALWNLLCEGELDEEMSRLRTNVIQANAVV